MESQKSCHQNADGAIHHEGHHDEDIVAKFIVVLGDKFVVEAPDDGIIEVVGHENGCYVTDN